MVLRAEVLRERIALLRETAARLRELAARDPRDFATEWALERGLQVAAQAVFDIGNHVLAGSFAERPADYAAVPAALARRGVIPEPIEARLQGLAGFRNLLVHDYARVDPRRVNALAAARVSDFEDYASAIEAWLEASNAG